jgi:hypothetical protein
MVVRLDYGSDVEEYEEVIVVYSGTSPQWNWMMWRNAGAVFVRSIDGRSGRYRSAAPSDRRPDPQGKCRPDGHQGNALAILDDVKSM